MLVGAEVRGETDAAKRPSAKCDADMEVLDGGAFQRILSREGWVREGNISIDFRNIGDPRLDFASV